MNILIIGATSGIGHNLWEHYVSSGHNVIVVGRRRELLDDMVRSCPEHITKFVPDWLIPVWQKEKVCSG
ncbi:MAG: SDR family NAD(P)-dependent oxidoreductase [Bacteroides sp.]|nr:SDR family NAD(P)-dependent oxidoreductase [Bacteroides sp.]MBD5342487.1 SDR family NAD(P)-dependent oxidoreductase [Bacteroides sp.]MBD5359748.1 SDR family NAD(P)-dependent oxidoreductase [Bacteroides sp.]